MGTTTQVSLDEYLNTTYHPDRDYLDGELVERNMGEKKHGRMQGLLVRFLGALEKTHGLWVAPELRVQIRPGRFRIPDVVVTLGEPEGDWVTGSPFLLIEILSERDSLRTIQDRIDDYRSVGARHIWIVDPEALRGWDASSGAPIEVRDGVLKTTDPDIAVPLSEFGE
jgi:Uma2 family endonuclease